MASYLRAFGKDRDKVKEVVKLLPSASEGGSLFLDTLTNTELLFSTVPAGEYFDWRNLACGGSKKMDAVRSSDRTLPTAGAVRAEVAAEPDAAGEADDGAICESALRSSWTGAAGEAAAPSLAAAAVVSVVAAAAPPGTAGGTAATDG